MHYSQIILVRFEFVVRVGLKNYTGEHNVNGFSLVAHL